MTQIPSFSIGESWSILEGKNDNNPMIVRKNKRFDNFEHKSFYKYRAGIAFKILSPDKNGFPNSDEMVILNNVEDTIFDIFQSKNHSLIATIITTSGFREYMLYTQNEAIFSSDFNSLNEKDLKYNFTSYVQEDPDWDGYNQF